MSFNFLNDDTKREIFQHLARKNVPIVFNRKFNTYTQQLAHEANAYATAFDKWTEIYTPQDEHYLAIFQDIIISPNSSPQQKIDAKQTILDLMNSKVNVINNLDISQRAKNELFRLNSTLMDYLEDPQEELDLYTEIDNIGSVAWDNYVQFHTNNPRTTGFFERDEDNDPDFFRLKKPEDIIPEETQLYSQIQPALNQYYTQMFSLQP
jgi:hypothetical protein